jgi:hypothetical protein
MGHIGNTVQTAFTTFDKQTITGNGGATYTLTHSVANEREIEVFVNNVRQEPSVAYNVSGNTLTMTGNVASTDDFYVVFQGKAIQTASHPSTSPLQATTGTFSSNLDVGGSLLVDTIKDGAGTNTAMTIDSSGRISTPNQVSFLAKLSGTTTASNARPVIFNFVNHNVGNAYDSTTGIFEAPVNGIYLLSYSLRVNISTAGAILHPNFEINNTSDGGSLMLERLTSGGTFISTSFTHVRQLSAGDEVRVASNNSTAGGTMQTGQCSFSGHLLG